MSREYKLFDEYNCHVNDKNVYYNIIIIDKSFIFINV